MNYSFSVGEGLRLFTSMNVCLLGSSIARDINFQTFCSAFGHWANGESRVTLLASLALFSNQSLGLGLGEGMTSTGATLPCKTRNPFVSLREKTSYRSFYLLQAEIYLSQGFLDNRLQLHCFQPWTTLALSPSTFFCKLEEEKDLSLSEEIILWNEATLSEDLCISEEVERLTHGPFAGVLLAQMLMWAPC